MALITCLSHRWEEAEAWTLPMGLEEYTVIGIHLLIHSFIHAFIKNVVNLYSMPCYLAIEDTGDKERFSKHVET